MVSFEVLKTSANGRAGCLTLSSMTITTPSFVPTGRRGTIPYLCADEVEANLGDAVVHCPIGELYECPALPLEKALNEKYPESNSLLRTFSNTPPSVLLWAGMRDVAAERSAEGFANKTAEGVSVNTKAGRIKITTEQWEQWVIAMRPDMVTMISDSPKSSDISRKKTQQTVERTKKWSERTPKIREAGILTMAAVMGSSDPPRADSCKAAIEAKTDGFSIEGVFIDMPLEKTCEMIGDLTSRLPTEKVRAMACDLDIIGCLAAVTRGVDLVASDYPSKLALEGKAILYDLSFEAIMAQKDKSCSSPPHKRKRSLEEESKIEPKEKKVEPKEDSRPSVLSAGTSAMNAPDVAPVSKGILNLWSLSHYTEFEPVLADCYCSCCASFTRAYLLHLLRAHEMNAHVYLTMHNMSQFANMFKALREAIEKQKLGEYVQKVTKLFS
eukprot:TRINITY_DN26158_c0_g1_i1.p1 TRINITY_DN26158_c0_g1~~TRINITY_DN26158_c0_g1_i1.p1  ORF type:complete len:472 (-),score=60.56 TRINITY_DN26158_c0_g1_i1:3-1325(-)